MTTDHRPPITRAALTAAWEAHYADTHNGRPDLACPVCVRYGTALTLTPRSTP
jgi:hypothetical protein